MRIAVIAHPLRSSGGLHVGRNFIESLSRTNPSSQYFLSIPRDRGYEALCTRFPDAQILSCASGGLLGRAIYELRTLPREIRVFQPDAILHLANFSYVRNPCVQALLCHNAYLFYPAQCFGRRTLSERVLTTRPLRRALLRRSLRSIDLLLCQTPVAQKRIQATYGYSGPSLLCPNSISFELSSVADMPCPSELASFKNQFKCLCLAQYYPHKNLEVLVEMFEKYSTELRNVVVFLTIASDQHPGAARLLRRIKVAGLEKQIVNLGPIPQAELAAFYLNSNALLLPTLLESFSGTYIEAMRFKVPILTSRLDFAEDVCGDAAYYFDPWDSASIKSAIVSLMTNDPLQRELVIRGSERLSGAATSWDQITWRVMNELETLVAEKAWRWPKNDVTRPVEV